MRLAGTGCPGEAADDIGGTCLGQAEPSAELRQRRVLLISELDHSPGPEPAGRDDGLGELIHQRARGPVALLGTWQPLDIGQGSGDRLAKPLTILVRLAHRPSSYAPRTRQVA